MNTKTKNVSSYRLICHKFYYLLYKAGLTEFVCVYCVDDTPIHQHAYAVSRISNAARPLSNTSHKHTIPIFTLYRKFGTNTCDMQRVCLDAWNVRSFVIGVKHSPPHVSPFFLSQISISIVYDLCRARVSVWFHQYCDRLPIDRHRTSIALARYNQYSSYQ